MSGKVYQEKEDRTRTASRVMPEYPFNTPLLQKLTHYIVNFRYSCGNRRGNKLTSAKTS